MKKEARCVICASIIEYRFGRPRKACDKPTCQKALQRLRVRRFKLRKKKLKGEARHKLRQVLIDFYEPTFTSSDLGNPLNIGSKMEIIPTYSSLQFISLKPLNSLTIEFVEDSLLFLKNHPRLVKYPENIKGKEKVHRIGAGEIYLICNLCYSTKLFWTDRGWYCTECGNENDFSLPIY